MFLRLFIRVWLLVFTGIAFPSFAQALKPQAKLTCTNSTFDFGTISQTQSVMSVFELVNDGTAPLVISRIQNCCGLKVTLNNSNIQAGASAPLEVLFKPGSSSGPTRKTVYIHTNDPEAKIKAFRLTGNVVKAK